MVGSLSDVVPNAEVLIALEPEELGLRLLPWISKLPGGNRELGYALREIRDGPAEFRGEWVRIAIREAWAWLEGAALLVEAPGYRSPNALRVLSRRAVKLVNEPNAQRTYGARHIQKDTLHPSIRDDVWALYHRGKFDTAVFEAMKAVEVAVRDAADLSHRDLGVALMRKAFDKNTGPLADMEMEEGEREARAHLFAGAIGSYKNPHSHRNVVLDDPDEAAEIILLANHLLRIVDARTASA